MGINSDKDRFDKDLKELEERCAPGIRKSLMNLDASEEDADDFIQEALCLLIQGLVDGTLVIGGQTSAELIRGHLKNDKLSGWLAVTASNRWKNELIRRKKLKDILGDPSFQPSHTPTIDLEAAVKCLEKILSKLSEMCQEILIKRFLDGCSDAQIASDLGFVSPNAAQSRIQECLQQARKFIGERDCLFI